MPYSLQTTDHKRGDTFARKITISDANGIVNLTGATITAQVKDWAFNAIATLTVDTTGAASGYVIISAIDTSAWPLSDSDRPLLCDVKIVSSDTLRTDSFGIICSRQVTD